MCRATKGGAASNTSTTIEVNLSWIARTVLTIGANARDAATADVDADGIPDMIVALQAGNAVGVLRGTPREGLGEAEVFGTMSAPTAVAVADLNDDGAVDLVTASAGPQGGIAVILATP